MARNPSGQAIPVQLTLLQFRQFILPHLVTPRRGPAPKISSFKIFNYILKIFYLGRQWKMLPIDKGPDGCPEIHYTRVYAPYRRWQVLGCFDAIFTASVSLLHPRGMLELAVIHWDGTATAAKKGGDNIGFSGHKK
jgi:transposase